MKNAEEDSEIRIAAYQQIMECPSDSNIKMVRNILASEQVNQVIVIWFQLKS